MDIRINSTTNFKSGMNAQILRMEKNIIPRHVENYFCNLPTKDWRSFYNIDFKDNKAMATASKLCADIFNNMRKLFDYRNGYSMQDLTSPQDLYVYNPEDHEFYKNRSFFEISNGNLFREKDKAVFEMGTVFMPNFLKKLDHVDFHTETNYAQRKTSTPHFLNPFIHEWLHAIFDKTIYSYCFRCTYDFDKTRYNYSIQELTDKEKEIISDLLSTYPASRNVNQYAETFAESWTKFICDSLSDDCTTFKKNPLDLMRATPKEFQEILKKVSQVDFINWGK